MRYAIFSVFLAAAGGLPAAAASLPPLSQDQYVVSRLVEGRAADVIRKTCPHIDARKIRALREIEALKSYAQSKGYSRAEINAFVDSKAERQKIKDAAQAWLTRRGAPPGDIAAHCRLGEREIAAGSLAGSLLYRKD